MMNSIIETRKSGLILAAIVLVGGVLTSVGSAQQGTANSQSLTQFGHQTNWESDLKIKPGASPSVVWDIEAGFGRGQVVGRDGVIYVTTGFDTKEDNKVTLTTNVKAIDLSNGETKWTHSQTAEMPDEQENFSGATIGPQATPAISGDHLLTISFAGQLSCLNLNDGSPQWKKDLVGGLGATPVQFGFSSSPLLHSNDAGKVFVLAAGESGGLYCLNVADGSTVWKSDCGSFSYATPTIANFCGVEQVVLVSRDAVLGVAIDTGKTLWQHELAEKGVTNVPTPLVIDESRLVISGQGCKGMRGLEIVSQNGVWDAEKSWYLPKIEYFYTNWTKLSDGIVLGCTDKLLVAFDPQDGSILGRWRGFSDGNVLRCGDTICILDGKGKLNVLNLADSGLTLEEKYSVAQGRSWTPLSVVENRMLIRCEDRLVCLRLDENESATSLKSSLAATKSLEFMRTAKSEVVPDPVEQISEVFQAKGQDAALQLYQELRLQDPSPLTEEVRLTLVETAQEQGLDDVADMILQHALEDFPDSEAIKTANGG